MKSKEKLGESQRQRRRCNNESRGWESERFEGAMLVDLKTEEGWPHWSGKGEETDSHLGLKREHSLADIFILMWWDHYRAHE